VGGGGVGHSEGHNMRAGMARETGIEFAGEGSIRGLRYSRALAVTLLVPVSRGAPPSGSGLT
jgi:hypothetical protein